MEDVDITVVPNRKAALPKVYGDTSHMAAWVIIYMLVGMAAKKGHAARIRQRPLSSILIPLDRGRERDTHRIKT
jgi:hypothetical protein